ncbi:hypothetical protein [Aquimarina rhabdastrellae]
MKKKLSIVIVLFFLIISGFVFFYKDHLPPMTVLKRMRITTGLDISQPSKIIVYEERYSFTGDGFVLVRVKFDKEAFNRILQDLPKKKYIKIKPNNITSRGDLLFNDFEVGIEKKDFNTMIDGYYYLKFDDYDDYNLIVIDITNQEVLIQMLIS